MTDRIRESTSKARFSALLLAVFATIALVLAAIGICGVMSYLVTQRTREIGIGIARGRAPRHAQTVVRRSAALAGAGIAIGAAGIGGYALSPRCYTGAARRSGNLRGDRRNVGRGGAEGESRSGAARYLGGTLTGPEFGVAGCHI